MSYTYTGTGAPPNTVASVIIKNTVTLIPDEKFKSFKSLTSVTFEGTSVVTEIGTSAFSNSSKLTSITIPKSVSIMGAQTFQSCSLLTGVTFEDDSKIKSLPNNVFLETNIQNIILPPLLTSLGGYCFAYSELTGIDLPSPLTYIGDRCFSTTKISNLTNVRFPSSLKRLEGRTFESCSDLTSVSFNSQSDVRTFNNSGIFLSCANLKYVELPDTLTSFGTGNNFGGCPNINTFIFPRASGLFDSLLKINNPPFFINDNLTRIKCSFGSAGLLWGKNNITTGDELSKRIIIAPPQASITDISYYFVYCNVGNTNERQPNPNTAISYPNSAFPVGVYNKDWYINRTSDIIISKKQPSIDLDAKFNTYINARSLILEEPSILANIGVEAFYGVTILSEISLPSTVTNIGARAFKEAINLTSITLLNSITSIGENAFEGCTKLTSIIIPKSVTKIDHDTFNGCSQLSSFVFELPSSCKSVGAQAFLNCTNLTSIIIPKSVTKIEDNAFDGCSNLSSVVFESNSLCTYIGYNAFYYCYNLTYINLPPGLLSIENRTFENCRSLAELNFPDSITSINGSYNFSGCSSIKNVSFNPTSQLKSMGENPKFDGNFTECTNLTSVYLPDSLTYIFGQNFRGSPNLKNIRFPNNSVSDIGEVTFSVISSVKNISCTVPVANKLWGNEAPSGVDVSYYYTYGSDDPIDSSHNYVEIGIPSTIREITKLEAGINFVSNITRISFEANSMCTLIGNAAFDNYVNLSSVNLPESLLSIDDAAFRSCPLSDNFFIPASVTRIGTGSFDGCSLSRVLFSEDSRLKNISSMGFYGNTLLTDVSLPNSLTFIDELAFSNCSNLTSITISNNQLLTNITNCFKNCGFVSSPVIPENITSIGRETFSGCTKMTNFIIPYTLNTIASGAFLGCTSLISFTINNNTKFSFSGGILCNGDQTLLIANLNRGSSFVIPPTITEIGPSLSHNETLTSVTISPKMSTIEERAFLNDTNLTTVIFPENSDCTYIGENAFEGCTKLTSIIIPKSVTNIGDNAFNGCSKLSSVLFESPSSCKSVGNQTFLNCTNLTSIIIPISITEIGEKSFYGCSKLTSVK